MKIVHALVALTLLPLVLGDFASLHAWCGNNGVTPSDACVAAEVVVGGASYYGCNGGCNVNAVCGAGQAGTQLPAATPACAANMNGNRYHAEQWAIKRAADAGANAGGQAVTMFATKAPCNNCVTVNNAGNTNKAMTLINAGSITLSYANFVGNAGVGAWQQNGQQVVQRCAAPAPQQANSVKNSPMGKLAQKVLNPK